MNKELIADKIIREHKELHQLLNDLKIKAGLPPDPYIPIDKKEEIKAVYQKYEQLLPLSEDEIIQMFSACGDQKSDYHLIKSKRIQFDSDLEDESIYQNFNTVTISETKILELIKKDNKISPETIAKALKVSTEWVTAKIAQMTKAGILESKVTTIGEDEVIERTLTKPLSEIRPPGEVKETEITIKYSYEGPKDDRNRPFCAKLLELDRLYSRAEIERISLRLGYSVFDRRGGWWTKPNGERSPVCRHRWMSRVVVKKR